MAVLLSCSNSHLIVDKAFRNEINNDYQARAKVYSPVRPDLFILADTLHDDLRREAVQFLLAYMPLSDLAVYEPGLLLLQVDAALKTRTEMPWGSSVPADLFLHFVLPPRVNNENPDNFRLAYYDEIKNRIDDLDAEEAALEINHWCHEKVAYQPSDSRTSSPMATILSARGRCGEESTFTVSALRTAGLPARQVYTPRWAHSDDNHAWVEVWLNGQWHYMGACEPEPVTDRGWFTEPARRAMLVHTKAFGRYTGNEPVLKSEKLFSEINTLDRYSITKNIEVTVVDTAGVPVPQASVSYLLYNYAEFYPLTSLKSDGNGISRFTTGLGSLLIWADDGSQYGFTFTSPSDTAIKVTISSIHPSVTISADLLAPPVLKPFPGIEEKLVIQNNLMLKKEDSIRQLYVNSWMGDVSVTQLSSSSGIAEERITDVLRTSMGNYRDIASFISGAGDQADLAIRLLENISEKDLRDTPKDVLDDHLANAPEKPVMTDEQFFDKWILSPRVDYEILTPFRSALKKVPEELYGKLAAGPEAIAAWIDNAVNVTGTENYYGTPVVPAGVMRLRMADRHSRDIFFVALCRTMGHAARLAPGTGRPQYHETDEWHDVLFSDDVMTTGEKGYVTFFSEEKSPVPQYHIHFSLAVLENGRFKTLDYGYEVNINDLPGKLPLAPGRYMLTTGNRDENGNVLASVSFFDLAPGEDKRLDVKLRHKEDKTLSAGNIGFKKSILSHTGEKFDLKSLADKGIVLIWVEPGKEPTRHILNDLPQMKKEFDAWGGSFIFFFDPATASGSFNPEEIKGMPENSIFAPDKDLTLMLSSLGGSTADHPLPVVVCCDSNGDILFLSEGYRIGTGEQILKNIR
jgi:transglutaminase-like putative cysteine protease